MDKKLANMELELERKKLQDEIAGVDSSIAQKKAVVKEMKRKYGADWKSWVGDGLKWVGKRRISEEKRQDLEAAGVELRSLSRPGSVENLRR